MSSDRPWDDPQAIAAIRFLNARFSLGERLVKFQEEALEANEECRIEVHEGNPNEYLRSETIHELADVAVTLHSLLEHPKCGPALRVALRLAYGRLAKRITSGEFADRSGEFAD